MENKDYIQELQSATNHLAMLQLVEPAAAGPSSSDHCTISYTAKRRYYSPHGGHSTPVKSQGTSRGPAPQMVPRPSSPSWPWKTLKRKLNPSPFPIASSAQPESVMSGKRQKRTNDMATVQSRDEPMHEKGEEVEWRDEPMDEKDEEAQSRDEPMEEKEEEGASEVSNSKNENGNDEVCKCSEANIKKTVRVEKKGDDFIVTMTCPVKSNIEFLSIKTIEL